MYPVDLRATYGTGQRSRGLAAMGVVFFLKALLALPHFFVVSVLAYAAAVIAWIGYFAIAFTGSLPAFFYSFPLRALEWQTRATGWLVTLEDAYPPFEWENARYSVQLVVNEGPGSRSRLLGALGIVFLKFVALIPHVLVLMFVQLAAFVALWVGYVAIVFTGTLPEGIFNLTVGALRWNLRVAAWIYSLTDEYPPFSLAQ